MTLPVGIVGQGQVEGGIVGKPSLTRRETNWLPGLKL